MPMKALLVSGGRIIDPGLGIDEPGSLLLEQGKISWLGRGETVPPRSDCDILQVRGLTVCPGFIDLHCHLREPGFEDKETIASGTRAAARGGFTTICCMPNTDPPPDSPEAVEYINSKAAAEGVVRVLPVGCVTRGRQGKELAPLDGLASAGAVGFSDDGDPVSDARLMRRALETGRSLGLPVIDHCEDRVLAGSGLINEGVVSARLGLRGIPAAAEEVIVARDLALAELTGGWLHVAHVSTAGSIGLIRRAREEGVRVTAEVTPHHLTLTEEMVLGNDTNAKVNPPLRTGWDVQALVEGLGEGVIDIVVTDHAPHTEADKQGGFERAAFGISGFETALGSLMGLVHDGRLTLPALIARLTSQPARIIGERYGQLGTLAVGAEADVVIFDPEQEWVVDTGAFASKGKNTPLAGATLKGKIMATIAGGELVYKDDSVKIGV